MFRGLAEVSFAQESFSDRVARRERQLLLANTAYVGFAAVGLVAALVSSFLAALAMGGGSLLLLGAAVLGMLPGVAPLVLGWLIVAVSVVPEVPYHLKSSSDGGVDGEEDSRKRLILSFAVIYVGLALLSLAFTVMLASKVGLTTPIFGVFPPAYVIPIAIEGMQVVALVVGIRLGRDLETLRNQAAQVRERELQHQLDEQELTVRLESQRLEAETKLIEADMNNRARRVGMRERLKLQQRTVKKEAAEAAKANAKLIAMRRDAAFQIAEGETQAEIDTMLGYSKVRVAANKAETDRQLKALEEGEIPQDLLVSNSNSELSKELQNLLGSNPNSEPSHGLQDAVVPGKEWNPRSPNRNGNGNRNGTNVKP